MHGCQSGSSERSKVRAAVTLMQDRKHPSNSRPAQDGFVGRAKVRAAVTVRYAAKRDQKSYPATDGLSGLGRVARLVQLTAYFDAAAVEREIPPIDLPTLTHYKQVLALHRYSWYMPMGYLT